jgi:histidinol-phosphate/aromatic aminotransferase/cobyric acid decarboxylase-like protein
MAFSRREFVRRFGAGGAALASASTILSYSREDLFALEQGQRGQRPPMAGGDIIKLSNNENLRGPGPKVIAALKNHNFSNLGLGYPPPSLGAFVETCAAMDGAKPNNVIISTGSGEILTAAVMA